jgi:hypothetical protein
MPYSQEVYDYKEYIYYAAIFMRDSASELYQIPLEHLPTEGEMWSTVEDIVNFEMQLANVRI